MSGVDRRPHVNRVKDGRASRIGTNDEVAWIEEGTSTGMAITAAIPPVFDAYATLELPRASSGEQEGQHDQAVVALLGRHAAPQPWWLGYLHIGDGTDIFPDAPTVSLYANWQYVLIEAGPEQAATSRRDYNWKGTVLPDLIFPADHSWLSSTLWDDDWTCIGGSAALVEDLLSDRALRARARRVTLDQDATPPGHQAR